jgi:hypothetical protein
MVEPLRHRQTKGAATDMPDLLRPRHIPTLPIAVFGRCQPGVSGGSEFCRLEAVPSIGEDLFDHLVGEGEQRLRDCQAERLSGFQIDNQIEFRRLINRHVAWLCAD